VDPLDRRIAGLALPALGALAVEPLYNLTDTAIVGHLGRAPLGGLAVATAVLNFAVYGCGFLSMATTQRVAFLRGRGDRQSAARAAVAAYWVAAGMGVALALVVEAAAPFIASVAGAHHAVAHQATTYLRVAAGGLPFVLCVLAGSGHLRGTADTRTPFVITLSSNALNVVLEVALVYGAGLGVAGSALGTVLAQVVGAALFLGASRARLRAAGADWRPRRREVRRLFSSGVVLVVRTVALLLALSGSTAVAARVGPAVLGGHQIGLQVWFLVALSLDALAVPAQILVGEALGAGDPYAAARLGGRVLSRGVIAAAGLGAVTAALAPVLPAVFSGDRQIQHQAAIAIALAGASLPLAAVAFELDGVLLGAGDFRFLRSAMAIALVGFLPAAAVTLHFHSLGIVGVWAALLCWLATRAAVLMGRWRSGKWRETPTDHQ